MTDTNPLAELGHEIDTDFIIPAEKFFGGIIQSVEGAVTTETRTLAQDAATALANARTQAAAAVATAKTNAASVINPIVAKILDAGAAVAEAEVPALAPLIRGAEPGAVVLTENVADSVALNVLSAIFNVLSPAGKTQAALLTSNGAGAVAN
jgi:hypothetical protein